MGLREMKCVKTWLFGVSNLGSHLTRAVFFITTGVLGVSCDCTQPFSIMGFHSYNYSPFLFPLCPLIQYFIILWYNILLSFNKIFYALTLVTFMQFMAQKVFHQVTQSHSHHPCFLKKRKLWVLGGLINLFNPGFVSHIITVEPPFRGHL